MSFYWNGEIVMMQSKEVNHMEQKKIGLLLKELRKEKGLTQEELAEKFFVSSRSVSRWETGATLPDLSILVELADFYNIDIREIINGERKKQDMNSEEKETLMKVVEYADEEKAKVKKRMADNCAGAGILLTFSTVLYLTKGFNGAIEARPCDNMISFSLGLTLVILFVNVLYFTGHLEKVKATVKSIKTRLFGK